MGEGEGECVREGEGEGECVKVKGDHEIVVLVCYAQ